MRACWSSTTGRRQQGIESLTQAQADAIQATELGHASKDLYEAIERGEFPRWELNVQIMSDDEHPELDFDPLDDTKTWPEDRFPLRPVGMMTLNRNIDNFFTENEQVAFGTGVLVDGLDFSDDKMLIGRTFSYTDTQRYRVGPNYLQLPVNRPAAGVPTPTSATAACPTASTTGAPTRTSTTNRRRWAVCARRTRRTGSTGRTSQGQVMKAPIDRQNNYEQAGERYRTIAAVGARRPGVEPGRRPAAVRQADPGEDGRAFLAVRSGVWRARGPGAGDHTR